ncbi:MAG: DinB family protein [Ferruginibacter sp.]
MQTVANLVQQVGVERKMYIDQLVNVSETQAQWKLKPEDWNLAEITEHLFWAEQGGIFGMWKTIDAIREGRAERVFESVHKDMTVQQIIDLTWQPKETVPAVAAPRLGGPLKYWIAALDSLQQQLAAFGQHLHNDELRIQAHPHPISGAMDFQQRFEFLGFHLARHRNQCANVLAAMG